MNSAKGRGFNTALPASPLARPGFRWAGLAFAPPSKHALPRKKQSAKSSLALVVIKKSDALAAAGRRLSLSLIHISEPTRPY